jgi:hypothetical protein
VVELFFYSLAAFGLSYIIGHARVSLGVREWMASIGLDTVWVCKEKEKLGCTWQRDRHPTAETHFYCPMHSGADKVDVTRWYHHPAIWIVQLIECPACSGFWIGLATGSLYPYIVPIVVPGPSAALALGLYTCAVGFLLGRATGWLKET